MWIGLAIAIAVAAFFIGKALTNQSMGVVFERDAHGKIASIFRVPNFT